MIDRFQILGGWLCLAVISAPCCLGQTPGIDSEDRPGVATKDRRVRIIGENDKPVSGATVYIGITDRPIILIDGEPAGGKASRNWLVRHDDGNGVDLAKIQRSASQMLDEPGAFAEMEMGMEMDGMAMGMESGPALPVARASYFVRHEEHGFGFVPRKDFAPRSIRLHAAAKLAVHVPRRYSAKDYVVIACWRNRFADPISDRLLERGDGYGDESMMMGGMSGAGLSEFGGGGDDTGGDLGGRWRDWRLSTQVAYWSIAGLEREGPEQGETYVAELEMPPGEVRVTLVPRLAIAPDQRDWIRLEQLLLFGGPSQVVLARSDRGHTTVQLGHDKQTDLEFVGRAATSPLPNWDREQNVLFLTPRHEPVERRAIRNAREAVRIAGGTREARSQRFLGRIAHRIAEDCYVAIGLPAGEYAVWSVQRESLGDLVAQAKSCSSLQGQSLQSMVATPERQSGQLGSAHAHPALASPPVRARYQLKPNYELGQQTERPGLETIRIRNFKPESAFAGYGGFAADSPIPGGFADAGGFAADSAIPSGTVAATEFAPAEPSGPEQRLGQLRRRIEQLERDLSTAKQMLDRLTGRRGR